MMILNTAKATLIETTALSTGGGVIAGGMYAIAGGAAIPGAVIGFGSVAAVMLSSKVVDLVQRASFISQVEKLEELAKRASRTLNVDKTDSEVTFSQNGRKDLVLLKDLIRIKDTVKLEGILHGNIINEYSLTKDDVAAAIAEITRVTPRAPDGLHIGPVGLMDNPQPVKPNKPRM